MLGFKNVKTGKMKMKQLIIGLSIGIALTMPSCKKMIEIAPEYTKDGSRIFKTLTEYEYALTGAYALFRATGYFGSGGQTTSSWANLPDMMADNLVRTAEDLSNWVPQTNWGYTAGEADIEIAWLAAYSVVAEANLVLRNIEQFSAADAKKVNRIKGQALAIRGIAHFDLLRFWGVDFDRNSTALGIPYVSVVDAEIKPARLSVKASYDSIFKDMLAAETLLGDIDQAINSNTNKSYIDLAVVRAMLARMYLYAKDYARAEEYATLVIDEVPLASKTDFPKIWNDASVAEVLWSVSFNAGEGSPSSGAHSAATNRNRFRPATPLTASYDQLNDIRFPAYFASRPTGRSSETPAVRYDSVSRKIIYKFHGKSSAADNVVNWKVIRTGELYLIRAEARALQPGKEVLGMGDLNALRAARINNYAPEVLTSQALLDAIQEERRKELFGEGHRWFDLKRTTRSVNRTDVALSVTKKILSSTAREWVWPVPQVEIDANANIKPQQSPGY
jgi:hypothetical protein